jgi:hypothetical protein
LISVDYRAPEGIKLDQVPDQSRELDAVARGGDYDLRLDPTAIGEDDVVLVKAVDCGDDLDLMGLYGLHEAILDSRPDPSLMDGRLRSQWRKG